MATPGTQMAMRLDNDLLARIDALAATLSTAYQKTSRSEAIRMALLMGLPLAEAEAARVAAARGGSSVEPAKPKRPR